MRIAQTTSPSLVIRKLNLPAEPQIVFYPEIAYTLCVTLISSRRTSGQQECSLTRLGFMKERKEKKIPKLVCFPVNQNLLDQMLKLTKAL